MFSTTGARETHHFSKSPRLSTKFKTLAPVDKSWHRSEQKYAFRLSVGSELFVFVVPVQQTAMGTKPESDGTKSETLSMYELM